MQTNEIKVLIVEDSRSVGMLLNRILSRFVVVGIARSGEEALQMEKEYSPDVITIDIELPDTDGLALTRRILSRRNVPIIIISALISGEKQSLVFDCLEAGAYEILAKSRLISDGGVQGDRLALMVKTAATRAQMKERTSVEPLSPVRQPTSIQSLRPEKSPTPSPPSKRESGLRLIAIGASTGGPQAVKTILDDLPATLPFAIAIAQHMSHGFIEGFCKWLESQIPMRVVTATTGMPPLPGHVYFPPSGMDLTLGRDERFLVLPTNPDGPCPCVDQLFFSVARTLGTRSACILLTGMGADGAAGMREAYDNGCMTLVQDAASCVIYGMPREAMKLCPEHLQLSLNHIAGWIAGRAISVLPPKPIM